jgi:hypothetical protein
MKHGKRIAVAAMLLVGVLGCLSQTAGRSGKLLFTYAADDNVLNFNKAIAIGGKLDLVVTGASDGQPVALTAASSSRPDILEVVAFSGSKATVRAKAAGSASLDFSAKLADGTSVTDGIDMRTAAAKTVTLVPGCGGSGPALYLTQQRIWIPYDLYGEGGTAVIGYGVHPLTVSPPAALTWDANETAQWAYVYQTSAVAGDVTLSSTLGPGSWNIRLVDASAIDGARLDGVAPGQLKSGTKAMVYARPTVGGQPVCQANTSFTLVAQTPDVCEVKAAGQEPSAKTIDGWSFVEVSAKQAGACKFAVTWSAAAGGKGVTQTLQLDIGKAAQQ